MGFIGVYRAIYDYTPNSANELAIKEGDLLFILEKSTVDDWWKAKKKADEDDEDEPEGLVPSNYVQEAPATGQARAMFDYNRQTDEELSIKEDDVVKVFDTSDSEWTLIGLNGEYGFAPASYIDFTGDAAESYHGEEEAPPPMPTRPRPASTIAESPAPPPNPASALAGIIQHRFEPANTKVPDFTPEASDEEAPPPKPPRPQSVVTSPISPQQSNPRSFDAPGVMESPSYASPRIEFPDNGPASPSGFRMYNIHELISHQGKNKKMPTTLGLNTLRGIIMIAPEKSRDGPQKEWTADKLTHYSIEGKHVFMELIRPSKSIDFHAGAKDTAREIVAVLGELAGAARAEGLREVIAAGTGTQLGLKTGHMSYEFMAQGDDEVTVAEGDSLIILDDSNEDWWKVRRVKNGKEGVVPSNYVEITGNLPADSHSGALNAARSTVEQNRLEEERLTNIAAKTNGKRDKSSEKNKRDTKASRTPSTTKPKGGPDRSRVRTWTDRTGSFKVDAEFLGLKEGKIHLHKTNGVKIAVAVAKMSIDDIEFVEKATGQSLDEDKPLSEIKRRSTLMLREKAVQESASPSKKENNQENASGVAIQRPQKPKYDWFDFFLACGVNPQICERYASNFARDEMGEENLPDIQPSLLRTLGIKEGDILRVMKHLDTKFNRARDQKTANGAGEEGEGVSNGDGGIFSGPGGALRNNTRKGRPAPAVQNNDTVDPRAFEQDGIRKERPPDAVSTPLASAPTPQRKGTSGGFEDDAWNVKPVRPQITGPAVQSAPPEARPLVSAPTGALSDLSLLATPLQPTPAPQSKPQPQTPAQVQPPAQFELSSALQTQPTGATRSLFDQIAQHPAAAQNQPQMPQQQQSLVNNYQTGSQGLVSQQFRPNITGYDSSSQIQQPPQQFSAPRQRPLAPQQQQTQNSLLPPPPPSRPMSAPQNNQPSAFGPPPALIPHATGYQPPLAPPGQSMNDINQARIQQSFNQQQLQNNPTAFGQSYQGVQQQQLYQPTGGFQQYNQQSQQQNLPLQQNFINSQQTASPFADPPRQPFQPMISQPTGYNQQSFSPPPQLTSQPTGINNFLPQPLQPQPTGPNGFTNGFGNHGLMQNGFGSQQQQQQQQIPPMPPMPQQHSTPAPLIPQKTGPAPPVRFGVQDAAPKLTPQPTGRANLSKATPQNPFGF